MTLKMNRPGFSYHIEDDVRRRYSRLKTTEKIRWLAEASDFITKVSTPQSKEIREKFRKARI